MSYERRLKGLNQASVDKGFEPFRDIDWDHPDMAIRADDARWILGEDDPLGADAWYRALPLERRSRIGLDMVATRMKVGIQFERILSMGMFELAGSLPDGSSEQR